MKIKLLKGSTYIGLPAIFVYRPRLFELFFPLPHTYYEIFLQSGLME